MDRTATYPQHTIADDSQVSRWFDVSQWPAETLNCWTHAAGCLLSLAGAAAMAPTLWSHGSVWQCVGCGLYLAALVAVYLSSTLSHTYESGPRRIFWRMADQVSIFLLVVGSYTPFGLVHARDAIGWFVFAAMWAFAIWGVVWRIRKREETMGATPFILTGWLPILTAWHIWNVGSVEGMLLVVSGGLAYTAGVWFLVNDYRKNYFHAIWHLCTIAGSALHFTFIWRYVA